MAVPLLGVGGAVQLLHQRSVGELGRVESQPHRAPHVAVAGDDVTLVGHGGDHGMRRRLVELRRVRALEAEHSARVLNDHALEAQAQSQGWNAALARESQGAHLAVDTPHPEPARNADGVDVT